MTTFASLNLSPELVSALHKLGYDNPSPVQLRVIPKALTGASLVCQSETGSGKTHSYLVPILAKTDLNLPRTQAIVLCPSRELARQVYEFAFAFTKFFPKFKVRLFTSETEKTQNLEGVSGRSNDAAPHLIVATPGRAKDILVDNRALPLQGVKTLVIDEADMLMELGYFDDIDAIFSELKEGTQTMVFSATLNQELKANLERYVDARFLYEGEDHKTASGVAHHFVDVKHIGKLEALDRFLRIRRPYLALVFASKKEDVNAAYAHLRELGVEAVAFSGDLDARERKQALRKIKSNEYPVVVASDLLARGIDIDDVSDVISLDLPSDLSYYYHRAGRTGRFGKTGDSWIFYNADELRRAKALLAQGTEFDYYTLKSDSLVPTDGSFLKKREIRFKHEISEDQKRDISIAKAKTATDKVKPGYKAKRRKALEKVAGKYRRKAIKEKVREQTNKVYAAKAKKK
ncbi:MAG: DEAD/DEAH box helicase [Erysipelotrichaceae bacterium]|nr:DEAD/DEAH box helicase [Erysipelotrichaceae bacterium]